MKKRWLGLLSAVAALCLLFGLAGCGGGELHETHEFGEWTEKVAATCTEEGKEERACACGEKEERPVPALGHNMTEHAKVEATCTQAGTKQYYSCDRCHKNFADREGSEEIEETEIPALGHNMTEHAKVEATCTQAGTKQYYSCDRCHKNFADREGSEEIEETEIPVLDHTPEEYVEREATCDVPGKKYRRCSVCHTPLSGEEEIPALGHDWSDWVSNGDETCTDDGTETRKCRRADCGASETHTRKGSALGHDYDENGVCRRCKRPAGPQEGAPVLREDGKMTFGSYPQTEVKDEATAAALTRKAGVLPTAENAGGWTDYGYYAKKSVSSYMWYIDVKEGNEKYRGVYFTQYRPYYTELGGYASLSEQDDNGYLTEKVYWFRFEPIEWRVLEQDGGAVFAVADLILDSQQIYHGSLTHTEGEEQISPNNYAESDIRAWLRESFYETAFTAYQKSLIETSLVNNSASSMAAGDGTYASPDTEDKVFLLGWREATNASYFASDEARKRNATDYAKSQGLKTDEELSPHWWLRSPHGNASYYTRAVDGDGRAEEFLNVQNTCYGVVPALRVRLPGGSGEQEGAPVVREDGKIEFGSYPQTEVTDEATAAALTRKAGVLPTAENAGGWTDYGYYAKKSVSSYMWYIDVKEGTEKYRGVYFTQYRPYYTELGGYASLSEQDDNGYLTEKVYWFRFEPIVWRALTERDGVSLLMADLVLDAQDFYYSAAPRAQGNETIYPNRYAESHIRAWLNETFYETAFDGYQRSLIEVTAVGCSVSDPNGLAWDVVKDKLFLLSQEEVLNESYGFAPGLKTNDALRKMKSTDYAKSQNVYKTGAFGYAEYTNWWLRTPGSQTSSAMAANYQGHANLSASCTDVYGVVPALSVRLG